MIALRPGLAVVLAMAPVSVALAAGPAFAASPAPAGATACSGCHGGAAASVGPVIAGRPAADIVTAMQAYRSGERNGTVMPRIAKGFTPEESEAIAAWWSAITP